MLGNLCRIFLGVSNLFWGSPILPPTDLVGGFLLINNQPKGGEIHCADSPFSS